MLFTLVGNDMFKANPRGYASRSVVVIVGASLIALSVFPFQRKDVFYTNWFGGVVFGTIGVLFGILIIAFALLDGRARTLAVSACVLLVADVRASAWLYSGPPFDVTPDPVFDFWHLEIWRLKIWILLAIIAFVIWALIDGWVLNATTRATIPKASKLNNLIRLAVGLVLAVLLEVATSVIYRSRLPEILSMAVGADLANYVQFHLRRWAPAVVVGGIVGTGLLIVTARIANTLTRRGSANC